MNTQKITHEELETLKSRSFLSISSLLAQSSYSAILGFVAFFVLTIKSSVYILGVYNTVLAILSFFNYLTNLGLAAALVQKKDLSDHDLNTAFILQLTLSFIGVIVGFAITPWIFHFYKDLPHHAIYLYWSMLIAFFLISFRTIPSVLLEKKVKIYTVVLAQAIENTVFYITIIILVFFRLDLDALIVAVLLRSVVGTILIYILHPWIPVFSFSLSSARSLLRFGIPFQGNSFLALIKDDLLMIYLGSVVGLTNLGYVTFAKKYAEFAIRLVTDNLNRTIFPLLSRFQTNIALLRKTLEKSLFYQSLIIFPSIIGLIAVFDIILKISPSYFTKWHSSIPSFYFFCISSLLISLTTPFINFFNALGKVKISLTFMLLWTILLWILVNLFIPLWGYHGISVAFAVMALTGLLVIKQAQKILPFSISASLKISLISTGIMGICLFATRTLTHALSPLIQTIVLIGTGVLVYSICVFSYKGKALLQEASMLIRLKKPS